MQGFGNLLNVAKRGSSRVPNPTSTKNSVCFDGKFIATTVTSQAATISNWVREIFIKYGGKTTVVGLDIEWKPNFVKYMINATATLQLCIDDRCLIVQLIYLDEIPQLLRDFLSSPNFTFVGVEVEKDIKKLKDEYGLICNKSSDIREVAKIRWPGRYSRPSLKDLAMNVAGLYMEKPLHVTMSEWDARVLSESQVQYACIDAYASYKIGYILLQN